MGEAKRQEGTSIANGEEVDQPSWPYVLTGMSEYLPGAPIKRELGFASEAMAFSGRPSTYSVMQKPS